MTIDTSPDAVAGLIARLANSGSARLTVNRDAREMLRALADRLAEADAVIDGLVILRNGVPTPVRIHIDAVPKIKEAVARHADRRTVS